MSDSKLGGLPTLSQDQTVTLQPAPVVSFDDATAAFQNLAKSAGELSDTTFKSIAEKAGNAPDAVTRDPTTGQPKLKPPSFLTTITGQTAAYENAAKVRYLSEGRTDSDAWQNAAREKYAADPEAFRSALDTYTGSVLNNTPEEFQPAMRSMLESDGRQTYNDLWTQKISRDTSAAQNSIDAALKSNEANIAPLVANTKYSNPLDDPALQGRVQQSVSLYDAKLHNPLLNYTQAQHDEDVSTFLNGIKAQAAVRQAGQIYQQTGDRTAAEQKYTSIITALPIPFDEQNAYLTKGLGEIREQDTLQRQGRMEQQNIIRGQVDDAKAAGQSGLPGGWRTQINESDIRRNFPASVAAQMIENLDEADGQGAMRKELALASPSDMSGLAKRYAAPSAAPVNSAAPAVGAGTNPRMSINQAIFGQESTFGKNAKPSVDGSSFGPMQIKPDTFAQYAKPGESIDNPKDNIAVGNRIVDDYAKRWPNDPARVAVAYFSGPGNVAPSTSSTPYLHDTHDANNKYVSAYVSDVLNRMGTSDYAASANIAAQWKLHNAFLDAQKQRQAAIDDDPTKYVLDAAPSVQVQLGSQDPATQQRGYRALLELQAHVGVPANKQTVFTKDRADAFSGALLAGSPDQAVGALKAVTAGMTAPQLQIAARQIAPKNRAFGMAVSAASADPATAANLIIGERYLLANPDAKPDDSKSVAAFDSATAASSGWFSSTGGLFEFAPDARANALAASDALYARSMIGQPTVRAGSKNFDSGRYQQAMAQALGGAPVIVRGQTILPPRSGMNASNVEDMVSKLDAGTIQRYGNGTPILANGKTVSASDIAQHGVLTWTGTPGIYRVRFPGQGHLGVRGNSGSRTFMLNLGAFATGAQQPLPGSPAPQALRSTSGQWTGVH